MLCQGHPGKEAGEGGPLGHFRKSAPSILCTCSLPASSDPERPCQGAVLLTPTWNAWVEQEKLPEQGSLMVYINHLILDLFQKTSSREGEGSQCVAMGFGSGEGM